jgi:transcriptional regulator with XRE-family HTH domain
MPRSQSQQKSDLSITRAEAALIGARIRQLRGSEKSMDFARRIGIRREYLSRIESGALPGTEILRRVAQVTGVSLDFLVFGAGPARREGAATGGAGWEAAVEPLLGGTRLRLARAATASRRRADRAWQELPDERKEEIRTLVRQIALVAVAIEGLLPARAARPVIDELGEALAALLVDRIVQPVS